MKFKIVANFNLIASWLIETFERALGKRRFCVRTPSVKLDPLQHGNLVSLYSIYRDYIKHEDDLINFRTTWFLASQGFLMAAFGLTLQLRLEEAKLACESSINPRPELLIRQVHKVDVLTSVTHSFVHSIPLLAAVLCFISFLSIFAANRACYAVKLQGECHRVDFDSIGLPGLTGGGRIGIPLAGAIASLCFPIVAFLFWLHELQKALMIF